MLKVCFGTMIALAALTTASTAAPTAAGPTGEWAVEGGVAHVRVEDCGGQMWGIVSWEQTPGTDANNPDPSKRARPTLGMPILLGMAPAQPNRWDGEIYNSNDGKTYSAHISMVTPDTLRVEGCVLGFLCGGQNWTRVAPTTTGSVKGATGAKGTTSAVKGSAIPSGSVRAQAPGGSKVASAAQSEVCSAASEARSSGGAQSGGQNGWHDNNQGWGGGGRRW